jgi:hypothetical protein
MFCIMRTALCTSGRMLAPSQHFRIVRCQATNPANGPAQQSLSRAQPVVRRRLFQSPGQELILDPAPRKPIRKQNLGKAEDSTPSANPLAVQATNFSRRSPPEDKPISSDADQAAREKAERKGIALWQCDYMRKRDVSPKIIGKFSGLMADTTRTWMKEHIMELCWFRNNQHVQAYFRRCSPALMRACLDHRYRLEADLFSHMNTLIMLQHRLKQLHCFVVDDGGVLEELLVVKEQEFVAHLRAKITATKGTVK